MSKNPVVMFYSMVFELLEKPMFEMSIARRCRDHYSIHSDKLSCNMSIVEPSNGEDDVGDIIDTKNVIEALKEIHTAVNDEVADSVQMPFAVTSLVKSAFLDMSHLIVSSVDAQNIFQHLVKLARMKDGDLFLRIAKVREHNGFATVTIVTDCYSELMSLIGADNGNEDDPNPNKKVVHIFGGENDPLNLSPYDVEAPVRT